MAIRKRCFNVVAALGWDHKETESYKRHLQHPGQDHQEAESNKCHLQHQGQDHQETESHNVIYDI